MVDDSLNSWETFFYLISKDRILLLVFWMISIFIIMVSYHIVTLCWTYNYMHFRVIFLCSSKCIYECQKWRPYWIVVAQENCASPITCGTEIVATLCRRLIEFLTRGSFETPMPDMLAVEWYYDEDCLDHNNGYISVPTQLLQKSCTATNLWAGFDTIFDK